MNLQRLASKIPSQVYNELPSVLKEFKITSINRLAHFLAQCAHESGNFKFIRENLNYSEEGLLKVFPKYFDKATAKMYARRPEMIANLVYANRMGNGGKESGDGFRFSGKGYIQLTGKVNYQAFSQYINDPSIMTNPDLVATKYPLTSAGWFFEKNKLWAICDEGMDDITITKLTKRINGGTHGLADRISKTKVFNNLLC